MPKKDNFVHLSGTKANFERKRYKMFKSWVNGIESDKVGFRRELLNIWSDKINSIDIINIDEQSELKSCPKIKKSILFTYH